MRARLRNDAPWWIAALLGAAAMAWAGLAGGFAWNDYDDELSGAMKVLIAGDVGAYFGMLPAYGGSVVLRTPFAWVTAR